MAYPPPRQFDSRAAAETQNPGTPGSQGRGTDVFSMNASLALRRIKGNSGPRRGAGRAIGGGGGALSFFTYTSGPLGGKMDSIFLSKKKKKKKSLSVWLSESQDWNTTGLLSPPQPQRLARPCPRPAASASPRFRGSAWGPGRRLSPGSRFPPRGFFSSAFLLFFFWSACVFGVCLLPPCVPPPYPLQWPTRPARTPRLGPLAEPGPRDASWLVWPGP